MWIGREPVVVDSSGTLIRGEVNLWLVPEDNENALAGAGYVGETWPAVVLDYIAAHAWGGFFVAENEPPPVGSAVFRFMDHTSLDFAVDLGEVQQAQWDGEVRALIPLRGVGAVPEVLLASPYELPERDAWLEAHQDLATGGTTPLVRDAQRVERIRVLTDELILELRGIETDESSLDRAVIDLLLVEQLRRIQQLASSRASSIDELRLLLADLSDASVRLDAGRSIAARVWNWADLVGRVGTLITIINLILALFGQQLVISF